MKTLPNSPKRLTSALATGVALLLAASGPALHAQTQTPPAAHASPIMWNAEEKTLAADIDNKPLTYVATEFKKATGKDIVVPPGVTKNVSVKFNGKTMNEGLSRMLDGLNYYTEVHGTESRIMIVDPNGGPAAPTTIARPPTGIPRLPGPPNGSSAIYRPPGSGGGPGGGKGDGKSGSTVDQREMQRQVFEALAREAARSGGKSGRDGGGDRGSSGFRGPGGSDSSGRSSERTSPRRD